MCVNQSSPFITWNFWLHSSCAGMRFFLPRTHAQFALGRITCFEIHKAEGSSRRTTRSSDRSLGGWGNDSSGRNIWMNVHTCMFLQEMAYAICTCKWFCQLPIKIKLFTKAAMERSKSFENNTQHYSGSFSSRTAGGLLFPLQKWCDCTNRSLQNSNVLLSFLLSTKKIKNNWLMMRKRCLWWTVTWGKKRRPEPNCGSTIYERIKVQRELLSPLAYNIVQVKASPITGWWSMLREISLRFNTHQKSLQQRDARPVRSRDCAGTTFDP